MNWLYKRLLICKSGIYTWLKDYKIYLVFLLLTLFLGEYTENYFLYSKEIDYPVTPWLLPFALNGINCRLAIYGCGILLFSNIFNYRRVHFYEIIRCGQKAYLQGKILYIFIASLIYCAVVGILLFLPHLDQVYFSTSWGKFLGLWVDRQLLYGNGGIGVNSRYIQMLTVREAMTCCIWLLWASLSFLGLLMYTCQVLGARLIGIVLACGFVCLDLMIQNEYLGAKVTAALVFVSPISWSDLENIKLNGETSIIRFPSMEYVLIASLVLVASFVIVVMVFQKKTIQFGGKKIQIKLY